MSEWPKGWMLWLLETTDRGVDTTCSCNCHCLCLWLLSVTRVHNGFVMIAWACGSGMGVGRFSRPLRGVGVLAMAHAGLDTTLRIESICNVPLGAGVPGVAVRVFIDSRCVVDEMEVTRWMISAMRVMFSADEGVQFWPWIVEATELPPCEESLSPACTKMRLLAVGSWEFPQGQRFCGLWWLARLQTFCTTGDMLGWVLQEGIVRYGCLTLRL